MYSYDQNNPITSYLFKCLIDDAKFKVVGESMFIILYYHLGAFGRQHRLKPLISTVLFTHQL